METIISAIVLYNYIYNIKCILQNYSLFNMRERAHQNL